ncbi:MAG: xly 1, partial [Paenibacillus sp.]|nr:xly 1 [Paenibacillus sp.]
MVELNARSDYMNAYDVAVYGGTSAGVAAAVQAARRGKRVVLIEQGTLIGGLTSAGLTASDVANYMVIGGLAREFYERIYQYYESDARWKYESHEEYMDRVKKRVWGGGDELTKIRWVFEPHVAEKVFKDMLREAGVSVVYDERLELRNGVQKAGNRIVSIRMENGSLYQAKVFIDTTYEGDLMAAAGVSYTLGRESNSQYGESLNGIRRQREELRIDPYIVPGNRMSGALPYVEPDNPGEDGEGDKRIQAYTFRL